MMADLDPPLHEGVAVTRLARGHDSAFDAVDEGRHDHREHVAPQLGRDGAGLSGTPRSLNRRGQYVQVFGDGSGAQALVPCRERQPGVGKHQRGCQVQRIELRRSRSTASEAAC